MTPILRSCCCCDLKVGTKIIGVLHLIVSIFSALSLVGGVFMVQLMSTGTNTLDSTFKQINLNNQNDPLSTSTTLDEFIDNAIKNVNNLNTDDKAVQPDVKGIIGMIRDHMEMMLIVLYIMLTMAILMVICSSMLIHGVRNDRRGLLVPWISLECLQLILNICFGIGMFVILGMNKIAGVGCISFIVQIVIELYCILIVISQYQALGHLQFNDEVPMTLK